MAHLLKRFLLAVFCCGLVSLAPLSRAGVADATTCIAPAKPGGGFDITCQLLRDALQVSGVGKTPMAIHYQPGGVGALAFKTILQFRPADRQTVVAFSSGSLLNLAQGRFGAHTLQDVFWLAVVGMDYGVVAVHRDSPFTNLQSLIDALRDAPQRIMFGSSGAIGSQDWIKAALLARAAGVSHKSIRVAAFEGGGDVLAALQGGHIQVFMGDTSEVSKHLEAESKIRVLAVLVNQRLPGRWAEVPTAREQGYDIQWSTLRGVYMGGKVGERARREWIDAINRALSHPNAEPVFNRSGFQYARVTGKELDVLVEKQVEEYKQLIREFGLNYKQP